jgi:2-haloalkanoic acid dehalogenase type II
MTNAIQAVIFDYYETLAQLPEAPRERAFDDLARRAGVVLPPGEAYRHWRELTTKDWELRLGSQRPALDGATPPFLTFRDVWMQRFAELFAVWGVAVPPELGADAYAAAHAEAPAYPEVPATLDALRRRYRLAVLSDADTSFLRASIQRNGLAFDAVVHSEELGAYKPHVSLFREACARLGVTPGRAAYVGDSPWPDVAGARHAGLRAVWLNRHGRDWPDDIQPPDASIASLGEVWDTLERLS